MGKNFNGVQMNNSPTIVEKAGAAITDCRNRIMKYDGNGDVVLATAGTDIPVGIALIESGYNDISGTESGKVAKGLSLIHISFTKLCISDEWEKAGTGRRTASILTV